MTAGADADAASGSSAGSGRRRWLFAIVGAIVVVGVIVAVRRGRGKDTAAAPEGKAAGGDRAIPVLVAVAETRDVPIYLEGLGTVTAYKTVNVRAQVDGRLDRVVFREGQTVKHGEVLAEIDPRPFAIQLHQGEAALARDQAQLDGAKRNLERYEAVGGQHLLPQQQIDDQGALVQQLGGTVLSDKAQIENAKLQLDYARIKSPIDGVTGIRQVDPGNIVHAADTTGVVVVTQLDPIAVLFTLPQDDLAYVARAQAAGPVPVEADSRDGTQVLAMGQLELIDNEINQGTATIRLKAIFPNPNHVLWPNQFVKSRLRLTVRKGAFVVPAAAVQRGPQGTFVYVVGEGDKADLRPVTVERIEGDLAIIAKGVGPGDRVVREGQSQLRPGARLTLREPGPAAAGAKPADGTAGAKPADGTARAKPADGAAGAKPADGAAPGGADHAGGGRGGHRRP